MTIEVVLATQQGSVEAPAGCGKTQLIIDVLAAIPEGKPCLVLTHTTAGVAALKKRLSRLKIPVGRYRINTLDGWALGMARKFPAITGFREPSGPIIGQTFYPALRTGAEVLLRNSTVLDAIGLTYSRLLVDEYQDCNIAQHHMVEALSKNLPTVVFGDPLQTIFNFGDPSSHPRWRAEVQNVFPPVYALSTPWRWENVSEPELGQWVLTARKKLLSGLQVDLRSLPGKVKWIPRAATPAEIRRQQQEVQHSIRRAIGKQDTFLVIGDSMNVQSRHKFAQSAPGIGVVEPVDLGSLVDYASSIATLPPKEALDRTLTTLSELVVGLDYSGMAQRLASIRGGRNRNAAEPWELAALAYEENPGPHTALYLMEAFEAKPNCRVYRHTAYYALKDAMTLASQDPSTELLEAMKVIRERRRQQGDRHVARHAIGSTLLLKGLEADHVLILDTVDDRGRPISKCDLYVALSRGAKSITVISQTPLVG